MVDGELARLRHLATRCGVATQVQNWHGYDVDVPEATIRAVLAALGRPAGTSVDVERSLQDVELAPWRRVLPPVIVTREHVAAQVVVHVEEGEQVSVHVLTEVGERVDLDRVAVSTSPRLVDGVRTAELAFDLSDQLPLGWHDVVAVTTRGEVRCPLIVTPSRLPELRARASMPAQQASPGETNTQSWGFMTQLYSVRSRSSWGIGDFADLRELVAWSGRDLDADFMLINPVHAAEPVGEMADSPYLPTTRRFVNPLYIRVEDIAEYSGLSPSQQDWVAAAAAASWFSSDGLLDRNSAWAAKRQALQAIYGVELDAPRAAALADYRRREGDGLRLFALWCAISEHFDGLPWSQWPVEFHTPEAAATRELAEQLNDRVSFFVWMQWIADQQLAAAQHEARSAGMAFGLVLDLAVGVHPHGADSWALGSSLARGVTVGAPPDAFNQQGQNWSQPPWRPDTLAESGYAPYRDMLRTVLRHCGGLRVDHVMGLFRLWWIPENAGPDQGTYVYYDHEALLGIMCLEAHRAGAFLVGEDLGVVQASARTELADRGVLGTTVLWFERDSTGDPLPPEDFRRLCLATLTTHDLPPTVPYLQGRHVDLRHDLGLLTRSVDDERAAAQAEVTSLLAAVRARGLLADVEVPSGAEQVEALHRYLALAPSVLVGVALTDAVGEVRTQNQPGTHREYPNWRIPLADEHGTPVFLDDLRRSPRVAALADAVRRSRPH